MTSFHVAEMRERPHSSKIWLDVDQNCLKCLVMKRLNMLQTARRMLVLDFNKEEMRNETVKLDGQKVLQGKVQRTFSFTELKEIVDGHPPADDTFHGDEDHDPDDAHPVEPNQEYHGMHADGFVTPAMDEHAPYDPEHCRVVIKFKGHRDYLVTFDQKSSKRTFEAAFAYIATVA